MKLAPLCWGWLVCGSRGSTKSFVNAVNSKKESLLCNAYVMQKWLLLNVQVCTSDWLVRVQDVIELHIHLLTHFSRKNLVCQMHPYLNTLVNSCAYTCCSFSPFCMIWIAIDVHELCVMPRSGDDWGSAICISAVCRHQCNLLFLINRLQKCWCNIRSGSKRCCGNSQPSWYAQIITPDVWSEPLQIWLYSIK